MKKIIDYKKKNRSHQKRNPLFQQYNPWLKQESIYYNNIIKITTNVIDCKTKEETIYWDDSRLPRTMETPAWVVWTMEQQGTERHEMCHIKHRI